MSDARCQPCAELSVVDRFTTAPPRSRTRALVLRELLCQQQMPDVRATPARRMQKDRLQAGHTIRPSDSGRQASERFPCCHKESAVAYLRPHLAAREPAKRHQCQLFVSETSSSAPSIQAQLIPPACMRSYDRDCGASSMEAPAGLSALSAVSAMGAADRSSASRNGGGG